MSEGLAKTLCAIHPARPASARCPNCRKFYCSECITEHEGKMSCASCLRLSMESVPESKRKLRLPIAPLVQLVLAIAVCWVVFYFFAQFLVDVPDNFHDGTVWE